MAIDRANRLEIYCRLVEAGSFIAKSGNSARLEKPSFYISKRKILLVLGRMQMNQPIRVTRTTLIVITVVFCFTGVAAAQSAQKIDACSLLTKAQIQAAVGQNVGDGKPNANANPAAGSLCQYVVGDYGVFSILVKALGPGETADKMMAELKKMKFTVSDAPGIGDRSFFSDPGYGMLQLNTIKGSRYLIITMLVPGATEAAQKTAAEKLMREALTKI
jgi:hypothetical protein